MPRTPGGAFTLAEEEPGPRARRTGRFIVLGLVLLLAVGGWVGARRLMDSFSTMQCEVRASGQTFTWAPDQASNSAVITAIALRRGMPARAATIALATAMQESKVRNITYGDRDSVGLFQQRPSQGWGTVEQILNPEHASNAFYDALVKVPDWQTADIAHAAQEVQRSADGSAYAQHESKARVTASVLAGHSPAGIGCRLDDPARPGTASTVADLVTADHGLQATVDGDTVAIAAATHEQAWALGAWAVARAADTGAVRVTVADREWVRSRSSSALEWQGTDAPSTPTQVVIHLR